MSHKQGEQESFQEKNCMGRAGKSFKKMDVYGEKIQLTYQGRETFNTTPGASVSIIVIAVILAYAIYRAFILVTLGDTQISKKSFLRDLDTVGPFSPQNQGFDFAFGIGKPLDPTYGNIGVRLINFYYTNETDANGNKIRIKDRINLDIDLCNNTGFNFTDQYSVKQFGILNQYCLKNKSAFFLNGDFYSFNFTYIEIKLNRCFNRSSSPIICQDPQVIKDFFTPLQFSVPYVNTFFDFNDYDQQVKYFIDDSLFWELDTNIINKVNFYVQKNEASLQDDFLQLGQSNDYDFYGVSNQRTYQDNYSDNDGYYAAVYLRIDNRYDIFERQIYSVLPYLGDVGGLEQSIFLLGMLFISFFTKRIFNASILKRIYQVKNYHQDEIDRQNELEDINQNLSSQFIKKQGSDLKSSYDSLKEKGQSRSNLNMPNIKKSSWTQSQSDADNDDENPKQQKLKHKNNDKRASKYKVESQITNQDGVEKVAMVGMTPRQITHRQTKDSNQLEIKNYAKKSTKVTSFLYQDSSVKASIQSKTMKKKMQGLQSDEESDQDSPIKKVKRAMSQQNRTPKSGEKPNLNINVSQVKRNYPRSNHSESNKYTPRLNNTNFQKKIKEDKTVSQEDVNQILADLINRRRFRYTSKDILTYLFQCLCLRKTRTLRENNVYKNHYLFMKAQDKLDQELDVITLLRSLRKLRLMNSTLLNQKNRMIMRFQRKNLVETQSSSSDSDDNKNDTLKQMENQNPMVRLMVYGKLKKMMMSYANQKLHTIDRNLIRGIYLRKIKDFKEDMNEKFGSKQLFTRLTGKYLKITVEQEEGSPIQETKQDPKKKKKSSKKSKERKPKEVKELESSLNLEDSMRRLNVSNQIIDEALEDFSETCLQNQFKINEKDNKSHRNIGNSSNKRQRSKSKQQQPVFSQKEYLEPAHKKNKGKSSSIIQAKLKNLS
ncbi:UNKNOWN [Stylonychia lemnae]|uniref:Transmembrane protein n=1 Tax=Stylonychia lemnae TaxID=5949 RepID=A0A078ATT3_STYLE|nr:UNKNOWN [Stylonychia lemnae]|eukprot:CDW84258.1 UNKNOWN [Stylonychia lemnae]